MKTTAIEKAVQVISTLAIENMYLTPTAKKDIIAIVNGEKTTKDVIEELDKKYGVHRIDKIDFLLREKTISKLAIGGERSYQNQIDSIKVNPGMSVSGDVILLVDDVTTSGKSLQACRDILLENGATRVAMFALGESLRD